MNLYSPKQKPVDGRWRYTLENGAGTMEIGYCHALQKLAVSYDWLRSKVTRAAVSPERMAQFSDKTHAHIEQLARNRTLAREDLFRARKAPQSHALPPGFEKTLKQVANRASIDINKRLGAAHGAKFWRPRNPAGAQLDLSEFK